MTITGLLSCYSESLIYFSNVCPVISLNARYAVRSGYCFSVVCPCVSVSVSMSACSAKTLRNYRSEIAATWYERVTNVLRWTLEVIKFWRHLTLTFDLKTLLVFWPLTLKAILVLGPDTASPVWEISTRHAANVVRLSPYLDSRRKQQIRWELDWWRLASLCLPRAQFNSALRRR